MKQFWRFAAMMLRYKRLIAWSMVGAIIDALCYFGGIGALLWVIDQFFSKEMTIQQLLRQKLSDPRVQGWIGDQSWLADHVPASSQGGLAMILCVIFALAVVGSLGRYLHQYFAITISLRTVNVIRKSLFNRLISMPLLTALTEGTADKLSRVVRDCEQMGRAFMDLTGRSVRDILQGLTMLVLAFVVDWQLSAIFVIGLPLIGVFIKLFGTRIRRATRRALVQFGVMLKAIQEALQSLRVVKVNLAEGYERRRFNTINRLVLKEQLRARTAKAMSSPIIELIGIAGIIVVALLANGHIASQGMKPTTAAQVLTCLGLAAMSFRPLAQLNATLSEASAAAVRVQEALSLPAEPRGSAASVSGVPRLPKHAKSVEFRNIRFRYPNATRDALSDVNLIVPQGAKCAIVGGNGSGKSTLLGLIPRLYEPASGAVLIDGVDIATVMLRSLRSQIAVVTQETVLFDGSIADNIRYGARHIAQDRIIDAARRAHAHEFISRLPQGYDTSIGEWGQRLSGGQRQRIAIARAILRDPSILILDEATSQIDSDSEANINAALAEFTAHRTTFVIAHRLSTVVDADMIVVMADGRIIAVDKHDKLLAHCEIYRILCQTQLHARLET